MQIWLSPWKICVPWPGCGATQWVSFSQVEKALRKDVALRDVCMGWGVEGCKWEWLQSLSSLSYSLGRCCHVPSCAERSWGDTSPWPHRALGILGADRFVTGMSFHGALSPSTLASSATSQLSFPVLWEAAVWLVMRCQEMQVLNIICIYICRSGLKAVSLCFIISKIRDNYILPIFRGVMRFNYF